MSDDVIISVEHLSKRYKLGQIGATTLRESAERLWHRIRGRDPAEHMGQIGVGCRLSTVDCKKESANPQPDKNIHPTVRNLQPTSLSPQSTTHSSHSDDLWALHDVSFEVKRGEVLGIIGRNGAGKSTLLKILSRITEPTSGRAVMRGRIASLLEVGTGFHPELTGRENIYLNGAILGMRKREIDFKFDEIVAFSEVERFIDTPVKRYSSGMYVRLAFAVAAHLDPEILLVDEVLAVGDASFQKKCLGKMGEVARSGRTVLFVSHNMAAIQQLCQRGVVLDGGNVSCLDEIHAAVNCYIQQVKTIRRTPLIERKDREGSQWMRFVRVEICDADGMGLKQILAGKDICVRFHYEADRIMHSATVNVAFNLSTSRGHLLANLNSYDTGNAVMNVYRRGYFQCNWPKFNIRSGAYDCALFCSVNGEIVDWLQSAFEVRVEDGDFYKTGHIVDRGAGDILITCSWSGHAEDGHGI